MKTYTPDELQQILKLHAEWLLDDTRGSRADLRGADLRGADLSGADLSRADLRGADLRGADLSGADLSRADLYGVNLREANLCGAKIEKATLPAFIICPEEGRFIGWKKARCSTHGYAVLKLRIEENSKRICSLIGRKCRASRVTVVDAFTVDGKPVDPGLVFTSDKDPSFTYQVGKTVFVEANEDIRVECSHGIHFFMTRKEAVEYSF